MKHKLLLITLTTAILTNPCNTVAQDNPEADEHVQKFLQILEGNTDSEEDELARLKSNALAKFIENFDEREEQIYEEFGLDGMISDRDFFNQSQDYHGIGSELPDIDGMSPEEIAEAYKKWFQKQAEERAQEDLTY